jgi:CPA1 family monovalent cation:H+ antiporter
LSIPLTAADGTPLPQRDLLLVLAVTVIVISLITQGLTLEPLVRRTAIAQPAATSRQEEAVARLRMAEAGIARLDELAAGQEVPGAVIDRMRRALDARIGYARTQARADGDRGSELTERDVRRDVLTAQGSELARLYADGTISAATCLKLQRTLDLEFTRISSDPD